MEELKLTMLYIWSNSDGEQHLQNVKGIGSFECTYLLAGDELISPSFWAECTPVSHLYLLFCFLGKTSVFAAANVDIR